MKQDALLQRVHRARYEIYMKIFASFICVPKAHGTIRVITDIHI